MQKNHLYFVLCFTLIVSFFILTPSGTVQQANNQRDIRPLRIDNRTQSLRLVDVKRNEQRIQITLENITNNNIIGLVISAGSYNINLDFSPEVFLPGNTHIESFTATSESTTEIKVSILAVVFEDGIGDGDSNIVRQLTDKYKGEKSQLSRSLPFLRRILQVSQDRVLSALSDAEALAMELPDSINSNDSYHFKVGLHNAKEKILSDIRTLNSFKQDTDGTKFQNQLAYITSFYERKASRLKSRLFERGTR